MKVVLVPHLALGHMIPFYQLGLSLAKSGVHVHYISTPKNIERLPKIPPNLSPFLNFAPIPFPSNTRLPEGAEASIDIPPEMFGEFVKAVNLLEQPVKQFVIDHSPDWVISDLPYGWSGNITKDCGVPVIIFSALSAAALLYIGPPQCHVDPEMSRLRHTLEHLTSPPPWVTFPSKVAYRHFEAIHFIPSDPEILSADIIYGNKALQGAKALAIRSCMEIEGDYLTLYRKLLGKPVIPVGLLPTELSQKKREFTDETWNNNFTWLDNHKPKSVVFVGFGSECKLTRDQIFEIANGLEESELPFIWLLRKPYWAAEDADTLPDGFLDRTRQRGKVCSGWAPQVEILSHPSIKVCFFHSGWGSIIEALQFGHALVVLPMIFDQGLNARLMVEKGLAIEVHRNEEDGSFKGTDIAKCLQEAMATPDVFDGEHKVKEAIAAAKDKTLQDHYVDELVKYLLENKVFTN